jgi:hypothetical protein
MWDNSIVFGRHLYDFPEGQKIPVLSTRVRQSLWGLPFLLPNVSIAFVRMWNGWLFSIPYALFGWILFRRKREKPGVWFALGLWTFVFLNQGPIYTPLVLAAVLVALSRRSRLWLGFLAGRRCRVLRGFGTIYLDVRPRHVGSRAGAG